jgi:hypothetical protein
MRHQSWPKEPLLSLVVLVRKPLKLGQTRAPRPPPPSAGAPARPPASGSLWRVPRRSVRGLCSDSGCGRRQSPPSIMPLKSCNDLSLNPTARFLHAFYWPLPSAGGACRAVVILNHHHVAPLSTSRRQLPLQQEGPGLGQPLRPRRPPLLFRASRLSRGSAVNHTQHLSPNLCSA